MSDTPAKSQSVSWWIASLATSVLCCSILFVLFASYIVDVKTMVEDTGIRIGAIQDREDKILAEIQMMRKGLASSAVAPDAQPAGDLVPVPAAPAAVEGATTGAVPSPLAFPASEAGKPSDVPTTVAPAAPAAPATSAPEKK